MKKYCKKCDKVFFEDINKCPVCGKRLKDIYSDEEIREIENQNDDMTVIDTMMLM